MLDKGLAALFAVKKVTLSEDVVKELVSCIDTTWDRQADWPSAKTWWKSYCCASALVGTGKQTSFEKEGRVRIRSLKLVLYVTRK